MYLISNASMYRGIIFHLLVRQFDFIIKTDEVKCAMNIIDNSTQL